MQRNKMEGMCIACLIWALAATSISSCSYKRDINNDSCLSKIILFADKLDLDKPNGFETGMKLGEQLNIDKCNFKPYRNTYAYKKSVCLIVLKLTRYFKRRNPRSTLDLLHVISASEVARKIVYEFFFLTTKKEYLGPSYQEVQAIYGLWVINYIHENKDLRNDVLLKKWIALQPGTMVP
jgi:hypothetical protein